MRPLHCAAPAEALFLPQPVAEERGDPWVLRAGGGRAGLEGPRWTPPSVAALGRQGTGALLTL